MITLRKAACSDLYSVAVVQVESNRTTYTKMMPEEYLSNMSYEEREISWRSRLFGGSKNEFMYVAQCPKKGIVGFASASLCRTDDHFERELSSMYLLKEFQGRGVGKILFKAVLSEYIKDNVKSMMLWTLEENPARKFYERLGGKLVGTRTIDRGGKQLIQVAYGWEDINSVFSEAHD